jgi:hypothetical protein
MDDEEIHTSRAEITSLLAGITTTQSRNIKTTSRKHQDKGPRNIQTTTEINFFSQ